MILQRTMPRFPNLMMLLATHFKEEMNNELKSILIKQKTDKYATTIACGSVKKPRLGKGFQKKPAVSATIPTETRIEK